jgi:ABC-type transport system involved in cytochrome bd biosynthesis fused ATPase/permease subunit
MDLKQRLLSGDLVAGVVAAVLVLVLAFVAGLSLPIAIVLALAAYVGIVLVRPTVGRPRGDTAEEAAEKATLAYETSVAKVATIRGLAARVQKEGTRDLVLRICDQSDRILAAMKEDNNFKAAPLFLEQLLEPTEALLETYVRLSTRGVKAADELLARNESQDLPMIERAARNFFERMHRDSIVDLAALSEVLEFNLENPTPVVEPPRRSVR